MVERVELQLEVGRVVGTTVNGVRRFAGIPYGTAARFSAPAAVEGWNGTRDASEFGPPAWQPVGGPELVPGLTPAGAMSEDCLTLTVWAPEHAEGLPVLVWIHGGSFLTGAPSLAVYDGARLAARGAVVVSVAYRLGPFGFVSFDALGGRERGWVANAGLHDVALALEWVRTHAGTFGGDARRVTVFGESAGGGVILHLLGVPNRRVWFDRAIVQSGSAGRTFDADTAARIGARVVASVGSSLDELAAAPAEQLVGAIGKVMSDPEVFAVAGMMPFHPCVDGTFVTAPPASAIPAGAAAGCDLVLGVTRDEMALFLEAPTIEAGRMHKRVAKYAGLDDEATRQLLDRYADRLRGEGRRAEPIDVWSAIYSDREMVLPARDLLDGAAAHHAATFGYEFTWDAPTRSDTGIPLGAAHAIDLPFTFGTFAADGWDDFVGATGGRSRPADALTDQMQRSWVQFAGSGDPGWPAWTTPERPTMVLGETIVVASDPIGARRALWP